MSSSRAILFGSSAYDRQVDSGKGPTNNIVDEAEVQLTACAAATGEVVMTFTVHGNTAMALVVFCGGSSSTYLVYLVFDNGVLTKIFISFNVRTQCE